MNNSGKIHNPWRRTTWRSRTVVIVLAVLVVIRACLPSVVESVVNRKLNAARDYGGRISHVDIQLWHGQYRIHEIKIFKRDGDSKTPLFSSPRVDLSIEWSELFHGSVVGQVLMQQPRLNFISGPPKEETLSSKDESWDKMLASLFPFKLNRLEITNGQIHFQNAHATPPVDIFLKGVTATATNLTNSRELKAALPAGVTARGTTAGGGGLDLQLQLNPMAEAPTYQLTCQLTNADLTGLNDFLKAYGKFDVEKGSFALYTSVASKDGNYEGYLKVFFENLEVFKWEKERQKNALEIFWQAIVGTLTTAFKNQRTDSLATKIPISGTYKKGSVGVWSAVGNLLRNAFVRALVPKLDETLTLQQVDEKAQKKEKLQLPDPSLEQKGSQKLTNKP